jgi:alpha-tubulin suppressor-like RCC1 family protein
VFSWGAGYQGQLGRKFERYAKKYAMTPEIVKINLAVRQVAAGALHSALVTGTYLGWVWCALVWCGVL